MPITLADTPTCVRFNAAEHAMIAALRCPGITVSDVLRKALRTLYASRATSDV